MKVTRGEGVGTKHQINHRGEYQHANTGTEVTDTYCYSFMPLHTCTHKIILFFFTLLLFSVSLCGSLSFIHWGQCSNREPSEGLPGCPQRSPNIILQIHAHAGQAVLQLWFPGGETALQPPRQQLTNTISGGNRQTNLDASSCVLYGEG